MITIQEEFENPMELPVSKHFSRRYIAEDTWVLKGFDWVTYTPHPHVIVGSRYAMVIDTTNLKLKIREYIEKYITEKPLVVASTHSHFDHVDNNYQFEDCPIYMSEQCWKDIQEDRKKDTRRTLGEYTPVIVSDGDVIDLGGHEIECIGFGGCHSLSSMSFLDRKTGCLYTGDELEGGQVLLANGFPKNCIELYRDKLEELKKRVEGRITMVCPPHNGTPWRPEIIDFMIENCERIMDGEKGETDVRSMSALPPKGESFWGPEVRRHEWKGTSIIYDMNRIFYRDLK